MSRELAWLEAIEQVLAEAKSPMHYTEIAEAVVSNSLRESVGSTPASTVNAQISNRIKH